VVHLHLDKFRGSVVPMANKNRVDLVLSDNLATMLDALTYDGELDRCSVIRGAIADLAFAKGVHVLQTSGRLGRPTTARTLPPAQDVSGQATPHRTRRGAS
jgi:hypothetical protein